MSKRITTTREYDSECRIVKETIVEEDVAPHYCNCWHGYWHWQYPYGNMSVQQPATFTNLKITSVT